MSMHSPDRVNAQWMADTGPAPVRLLLAGVEGEASALVGAKAAGFPLELVIADPTQTGRSFGSGGRGCRGGPGQLRRSIVGRPLRGIGRRARSR